MLQYVTCCNPEAKVGEKMADKIIRPDFSSVRTEYKELGLYLNELQKICASEGGARSSVRQKIASAAASSSEDI